MTATTIVPKEKSAIEMFVMKLYAKDFTKKHEAELNSTSPFAITDKTPTRRIVDNPITKGSWSVSPVHSSVTRGFFGGVKGVSVSGGGGGGSIDTKVQFDNINLCPATGKEFLDSELEAYKDGWRLQRADWVKKQMEETVIERSVATLNFTVRFSDGTIREYEPSYADYETTFKQVGKTVEPDRKATR